MPFPSTPISYPCKTSLPHYVLNSGNDTFSAGNVKLFQRWAERHRRMRRRYQLDGRIEFGESFVGSERGNVCSGAAARVVLVNDYYTVPLGDQVYNISLLQRGK